MNALALALAPCLLAGAAIAQDRAMPSERRDPGFFERTVVVGGVEHRYAVFLPRAYTPKQRWPLIVFLNGMGECGTDGWKQTEVGLGPAIRADEARWPFVVAFPQKPDKGSQWSEHGALVLGVIRDVEATWYVDDKRRFLTGISQGGAGTWALGSRHADLFAAIAPVCGYGKPDEVATNLKSTPIWAFHGADDTVVPVQQSQALCAAVEAVGGSPVLTVYAKTAHNAWDQAYRESGLAEWLRTVAVEPVLARYLAEPSALTEARFEIERVVAPRGERPRRATASLHARERSIAGWWSDGADVRSDQRSAGAVSSIRSWQELGDVAQRRVHEPLRAIVAAGVLDAAAGAPEPGEAPEQALWALTLQLRGGHGDLSLRGAGRADGPNAAFAHAVRTLADAIAADLR